METQIQVLLYLKKTEPNPEGLSPLWEKFRLRGLKNRLLNFRVNGIPPHNGVPAKAGIPLRPTVR